MKYVNLTTRHHDSFCLFRTQRKGLQQRDSPARRDLVRELVNACEKRGLGLFLYYSYGLDWRHPYFLLAGGWHEGAVQWDAARPDYALPQPEYLFKKDDDFRTTLSSPTPRWESC